MPRVPCRERTFRVKDDDQAHLSGRDRLKGWLEAGYMQTPKACLKRKLLAARASKVTRARVVRTFHAHMRPVSGNRCSLPLNARYSLHNRVLSGAVCTFGAERLEGHTWKAGAGEGAHCMHLLRARHAACERRLATGDGRNCPLKMMYLLHEVAKVRTCKERLKGRIHELTP